MKKWRYNLPFKKTTQLKKNANCINWHWSVIPLLRLHMVGQKRQLQLAPITYIPIWVLRHTSIAHRWVWLLTEGEQIYRANRLGLKQVSASAPDILIAGMQHAWSHCLATRRRRLWPKWKYQAPSILLLCWYRAGSSLVFDRYDNLSAKDHERKRGAGEGSTDYNLTANSPLLNRNAILKNKLNKRELSRVLSLFNLCPNVIMDSWDDGACHYDMVMSLW